MKIDKAWRRSNGSGIRIGITDTGIDQAQSELLGLFSTGESSGRTHVLTYSSRAPVGQQGWNDNCGHGTRLASVVAAPRNGASIVGIAWKADIVSVRQDDDVLNLSVNDAAMAIRLAAQNNSRIILLAWGSHDYWSTISDEIQYWYYSSLQPLFIGAAGTSTGCDQPGRDNVIFPADLGFVMAVSAVKANGDEVCDAHYGPEVELVATIGNSGIEAAGPVGLGGANIVSLGASSAATAVIGGIAALTWSRYPQLSRDALWDRLRQQGHIFTSQGPPSNRIGYGILDAHRAVGGLADVIYHTNPRAGVRTKVTAVPIGDGPFNYLWPSGETSQTIYIDIPVGATSQTFNVQVTDTFEGEVLSKPRTFMVAPSPTLSLSGPSSVSSKGSYAFTALYSGYDNTVQFAREEKLCDSCMWAALGTTTSAAYARTLQPNCTVGYTTYQMRITAWDDWGGNVTATRSVNLCVQ
jgi:hypothetical protein